MADEVERLVAAMDGQIKTFEKTLEAERAAMDARFDEMEKRIDVLIRVLAHTLASMERMLNGR